MFVIYALVDPRDSKERYVGRTQDVLLRFIQHLRGEGKNEIKNTWIQELRTLQLVPIMKTLELVDDAALAGQREAYWIRHFRYLGLSLTNDTHANSFIPDEEEQFVEAKPSSTSVRGDAAKRVMRILRRNPNIKSAEVARRAGVSAAYVSKLRSQKQV